MKLEAHETVIQGFWLDLGSSRVPDSNWDRINLLTNEYLSLAATASDCAKLFLDPDDGRLWELTSAVPGVPGSPPMLAAVEPEYAEQRYGFKR